MYYQAHRRLGGIDGGEDTRTSAGLAEAAGAGRPSRVARGDCGGCGLGSAASYAGSARYAATSPCGRPCRRRSRRWNHQWWGRPSSHTNRRGWQCGTGRGWWSDSTLARASGGTAADRSPCGQPGRGGGAGGSQDFGRSCSDLGGTARGGRPPRRAGHLPSAAGVPASGARGVVCGHDCSSAENAAQSVAGPTWAIPARCCTGNARLHAGHRREPDCYPRSHHIVGRGACRAPRPSTTATADGVTGPNGHVCAAGGTSNAVSST
jgi:hypothetical protein